MTAARQMQKLGPYVLGERLGVGGMAEVFLARSEEHGRVAVKRILPGLAQDQEFADMFWDEARVTSRLDHPNVMRVLDYGRIDGQLFMALEHVDGPSVARLLRKAASRKKALDPAVAVSIAAQLLDALGFVHQATDDKGRALSIVHRDVSPGNVLLGLTGQVKLGDFGIVRSDLLARRTQPGELKGKIGYMSPEQASGAVLDPRSDLFSVGIILAELLTLKPLLLGKHEMQTLSRTLQADLSTWHRFNGDVPLPLRSVVERALQKDRGERYQSAGEMRRALADAAELCGYLGGEGVLKTALADLEFSPLEEDANDGSGARPIGSHRGSSLDGSSLDGSSLDGSSLGGSSLGGSSLGSAITVDDLATMDDLAGGGAATAVDGRAATNGDAARPASGEYALAPLGPLKAPSGRPIWKVGFDRQTMPGCLFLALRRASTGTIVLSTPSSLSSIEISGGRIISVSDSGGKSALGRLLVDASILTSGGLVQAIGESRRARLRLGEYLVARRTVRESILRRLLRAQTQARLAPWFSEPCGSLSVYVDGARGLGDELDAAPESLSEAVAAMRVALDAGALNLHLQPVLDSIVLPASVGIEPESLGLTPAETRALRSVLRGGVFEGSSLRHVLAGLASERIAQPREAGFALVVALGAGLIHAPGFRAP